MWFAFGSNVMHALMRLHPAPEPPLPRPFKECASLPPHIFTPAAPRCPAGVKPAILDDKGNELEGEAEGILAIKQPWPSTLRTVYGDHQRYQVGLLSWNGSVMLVVESKKNSSGPQLVMESLLPDMDTLLRKGTGKLRLSCAIPVPLPVRQYCPTLLFSCPCRKITLPLSPGTTSLAMARAGTRTVTTGCECERKVL